MNRLDKCKRLVVKIGSALLVDEQGSLRNQWLRALCADIAQLSAAGIEVVVVSSGAVALGRPSLGLSRGSEQLAELQAAAAIGQIRLASAWLAEFAAADLTAAQILLTLEDTEERRRYLNALDTLRTLLGHGAIPIINENDSVATDEIRYGDNDRLAARVAQMIEADHLLLLSNVDGLYDRHPDDPAAKFIETVEQITEDVEAMASERISSSGTGGMSSKLAAAGLASAAGCNVYICNALEAGALKRFQDGVKATHFPARERQGLARKRWIAAALKPTGKLWLDDGAVAALDKGKSLLAVGVTRAEGDFKRGDTLQLLNSNGHEVARGLSAYAVDDARRMIARQGGEAVRGSALVHRNDLVLTTAAAAKKG